VDVPASRLKNEIARILREEGYILNYKLTEEGFEEVHPFVPEVHAIQSAGYLAHRARVAPGCRVYVGSKEIPRILGGLGINILTTPKGVMTGTPHAKKALAAKCSVRSGKERKSMSRVGKKPIPLPKGVKITIGDQLEVEGPKGKLSVPIPEGIQIEQKR
jgi:small subunit ribosomal protein S8